MNYINFSDRYMQSSSNNIGTVGTENDKSSEDFNELINKVKLLGGEMGGLNNSTLDSLALMASKDGAFDVVSYLINKNLIKNLGIKDKEGFTILHYLIMNYSKINNADKILDMILGDPNIHSFINSQDNINKDTPLHLAVSYGLDNVAEKLIMKGADKTMFNNKNEYVGTDNEHNVNQSFNPNVNNNVQHSIPNNNMDKMNNMNNINPNINNQNDIFLKKNNNSGLDNVINNIVDLFLGTKKQYNEKPSSEASLRMTDAFKNNNEYSNNAMKNQNISDSNNTSAIINDIIDKNKNKNNNYSNGKNESEFSNNNTSAIINDVLNKSKFQMSDNKNDTSDLIEDIVLQYNNGKQNKVQTGGKSSIHGQRKMKTFSDYDLTGGQTITDSNTSLDPINDGTDYYEEKYPNLDTYTGWSQRKQMERSKNNKKYADEKNSDLNSFNNNLYGTQTVGDVGNSNFRNRNGNDYRELSRYSFDPDIQNYQARSNYDDDNDYKFSSLSRSNDTATSDNKDYQKYNKENTATSDYSSDSDNYDQSNKKASYSLNRSSGKNNKMESNNSKNNKGNNNELSRLIQNQADVIHKRTVEKIRELLGVDEDTAKIYKAALYNKVKSEHPELNNFDRAVEMEKLATTANLDKINLKEWKEKINKAREEKQSKKPNDSSSEQKNKSEETAKNTKKKSKKDKNMTEGTDTSLLSVQSGSGMSDTSFD